MKVIQVLQESHAPGYDPFHAEDWHAQVAREIAKRTDKYEIECWRLQRDIKKTVEGRVNGLPCRIFPAFPLGPAPAKEFSPALLRALAQERKGPAILHLHRFTFPQAYASLYLFRGHPILAQGHEDFAALFKFRHSRHPLRLYHLFNHFIEKKVFRYVDRFFVLTQDERVALASVVPPQKITVQTMGVDFNFFRPLDKEHARAELGLDRDGKYILITGRVEWGKGVQLVISALPHILDGHPQATLLVAGRGSYQGELETLAGRLGVAPRVKFLGFVPEAQMPALYNAADVFVLPVITHGVCITLVEALACGTPAVAHAVRGVADGMTTFRGGLMVPVGDVPGLANAVLRVLENHNTIQVDIERGRQHYSWEAVARHTIEVYDQLVRKHYPDQVG